MNRSRPLGRAVAVLIAGLTISACAATTSSGVRPDVTSTSIATTLPSASTPVASTVVAPSGTPIAVTSAEPTDVPEPTEAPAPRPSEIAGCGTGEAGFTADRTDIPTLAFGHATIEFTPAGAGMRDGSWNIDDMIPAGVGLTANEIAVVVGPGDHIILRGSGITILDTTASAVPWSMVSFEGSLANLAGQRTSLAWRVRADGSLSISAPAKLGDWAVEFVLAWQSACLRGDGTAYARIKVR
jgi:hypothetical protein